VQPVKTLKRLPSQYEAGRTASASSAAWMRLLREGARHSWWHHPSLNTRSAVPRHTEITNHLARKICKDLKITKIS